MKKQKLLPSRPSTLLRLAVKDAKKIERTSGYRLNMVVWHQPPESLTGVDGKLCEVCLAGSVMACSLGANPSVEIGPHSFDVVTQNKLYLINDMRTGWMGYVVDRDPSHVIEIERIGSFIRRHIDMNRQRAPWWVYLKAADRLRRLGL